MLENVETYINDIVEWFKKLFTIISEFLSDIGVEV